MAPAAQMTMNDTLSGVGAGRSYAGGRNTIDAAVAEFSGSGNEALLRWCSRKIRIIEMIQTSLLREKVA